MHRFNYQYEVVKDVFDGQLLYPPFDRITGYFVLECGTGTGKYCEALV